MDQYGNALSMTTTIESPFGNGLMVRGFLLNNQLTDFSFDPVDSDGVPIANRVQPSKRPRSSMSPTIVRTIGGEVLFLAGSPGGSRIIGYTSKAILGMIDFDLDPQQACHQPHTQNQNGNTEIESPSDIIVPFDFEGLVAGLEERNHTIDERSGEASGLSLIAVVEDGFLGGADPRRDGTAGGRESSLPTTSPAMMPTTDSEATATDGSKAYLVAAVLAGVIAALI